jgi:hypothetical protein
MFLIYESLILFGYPTTETRFDALVGANSDERNVKQS